MYKVINCVAVQHDLWLVAVAAGICIFGSWATLQLLQRAATTVGAQRLGWLMLTAVASGASIWCTHFVAMLGYRPEVPIVFDPVLTGVSLLVAIAGTAGGVAIATMTASRYAPAVGGAVVGLAISAMHYTGMAAYRVEGLVEWNAGFVAASIAMSVLFGGLALHFSLNDGFRYRRSLAVGCLIVAIVSLHFTAMTAFEVTPLALGGQVDDSAVYQAMGITVAFVAFMVIGAGLASHLIDSRTRSESVEQLAHMATHDALTGLPNRSNFNDYLDRAIRLARSGGRRLAVVGIDLDRFKEINDLRGHSAGDEVLCLLSQRMRAALDAGEFVARVGGDEFAAIKDFVADEEICDFLSRFEHALKTRVSLSGYEASTGASIGVAIFPDNGDSADQLVNNADLAMYRAKSDRSDTPYFYDRKMDEMVREERALARDLQEAIAAEALEVHYQVQTSVQTGEIRGYEALLRWRHPVRGNISPGVFIPLAEEHGLILELGKWVLKRACADAVEWNPSHKVAVNVSAVQFAQDDLPRLVHQVLLETGLSPRRLELELTETMLIANNHRSLHMLNQIKALGVSVALDDFGTGYSSLGTLRTFPFDKIKLDQSFMSEAESSMQARAIIRAVLALGKSLEVPVLAEGVEKESQLAVLREVGCDEAQGFLLGRPAPFVSSAKRERATDAA